MLRHTEERLLSFCLEQVADFDPGLWVASEGLDANVLVCACAYLKTTDWYPRAPELRALPTPHDWLGLTRLCHFDVSRFKHRLQHGLAQLS